MNSLTDAEFWILMLVLWFFGSLAVGLFLGKVFHRFNGEFDHADTVDRARDQMRQELWK
jgi:uncharacterized membrane protein